MGQVFAFERKQERKGECVYYLNESFTTTYTLRLPGCAHFFIILS